MFAHPEKPSSPIPVPSSSPPSPLHSEGEIRLLRAYSTVAGILLLLLPIPFQEEGVEVIMKAHIHL